jgi:error-prone DNA polymerase
MGFYIPDALVHEAQRRGLTVLAPDINKSGIECAIERLGDELAIRIGLAYVKGIRADEIAALVAARESDPTRPAFTSLGDLGARAGAGRSSLELLAWSGACDALAGGDRRTVLWQLGIASPGRRVIGGTQLALPLELPAPPALAPLDAWPEMLADYATTGLTANGHPLELLRPSLPADAVTSEDLKTIPHGRRVRVGGMVVARQRPGTANGIVFLLVEDERGTINLIVPPNVYERHRVTTRTEPLILAEGRLERHPAAGGGINILVDRVRPIDVPDRPLAEVKDFSMLDEKERRRRMAEEAAQESVPAHPDEAGEFRAVAPPVMSFASGRRR